jgi:hypothetical protein
MSFDFAQDGELVEPLIRVKNSISNLPYAVNKLKSLTLLISDLQRASSRRK